MDPASVKRPLGVSGADLFFGMARPKGSLPTNDAGNYVGNSSAALDDHRLWHFFWPFRGHFFGHN